MKNTTEFLYLFDLLDFDENGNVAVAEHAEQLLQAQSNFLFLVAKYNRFLVKKEGMELPEFFKEELAQLLIDLEIGEKTFVQAKQQVLENCLPQVQKFSKETDKALILALNGAIDVEIISKADKNLALFMKKNSLISNRLEKSNKLTRFSDIKFGNIIMLLQDKRRNGHLSKDDKKFIFNDIITYNALVKEAKKVASVVEEKAQESKTVSAAKTLALA